MGQVVECLPLPLPHLFPCSSWLHCLHYSPLRLQRCVPLCVLVRCDVVHFASFLLGTTSSLSLPPPFPRASLIKLEPIYTLVAHRTSHALSELDHRAPMERMDGDARTTEGGAGGGRDHSGPANG